MSKPSVIAIDGPAAAGKTTLGHALAQELDYLYFDTGVMYRAVTLAALEESVDLVAEERVAALARRIVIDVTEPTEADGRLATVCIDGRDVTHDLRSPTVDANVSRVAAYPGVREAMTHQQRRIAERGQLVMVGRDIGTVVLPDADLKLFLVADVETRARRRHQEYSQQGRSDSYDDILESMQQRDRRDREREVAPLRAAPDAIRIDTSAQSTEEVLRLALRLIEKINGA
ncbi:MAG: (d)CMP kinase [Chloroflexi bacterium]|nr:(d)CMP kinase [Chloroflexota bacterium]